jgi:hypothetical protein
LILTYFYGKFTAKNWKFTTKLDFFRKKTIPTWLGWELPLLKGRCDRATPFKLSGVDNDNGMFCEKKI